MQIDIRYEWYTDYAWDCVCGKQNIEPEGQLDLDDGENIFCTSCSKEYILNKPNLKLSETREE